MVAKSLLALNNLCVFACICELQAAALAWEAYKKQVRTQAPLLNCLRIASSHSFLVGACAQYAEWYEAFGKAQGADPNPPAM